MIIRRLTVNGKNELARTISDHVIAKYPDNVVPSLFANITNLDWPIIIRTMPDSREFKLRKVDIANILRSTSREEETRAAIAIKQRAYRKYAK